jgi:sugar/nucleoside kinase (ribokinase family)
MNKRNDFICIGAVHYDYEVRIKGNFLKNRTNPVKQEKKIGGVAYNIAKLLSILKHKTKLYSLDCDMDQKIEIISTGIKFKPLTDKFKNRYYTSVLDKNGKMILGLANMDEYEKKINPNKINEFINKNIIIDLNFSKDLIKNVINKNYKKNYICVCGTSAHKILKIKYLLKKIHTIILNKQESLNLTNTKTIKQSMNCLILQNKKLNIIITNGKYAIHSYFNKVHYVSYPPKIKIKNENGAGDALNAIFNYYYCLSLNGLDSLNKGISGGALMVSRYNYKNKKYLTEVNKLSKLIRNKIVI